MMDFLSFEAFISEIQEDPTPKVEWGPPSSPEDSSRRPPKRIRESEDDEPDEKPVPKPKKTFARRKLKLEEDHEAPAPEQRKAPIPAPRKTPIPEQRKTPIPKAPTPEQRKGPTPEQRKPYRRTKLRKMAIAAEWQKDGHPGAEFLNKLGLGSLTTIDWSLSDASLLAPSVKMFIRNYSTETRQSEVDGRVIKLSPELIARLLQIPNRGLRLDVVKNVRVPDRLKLFSEGAYNSRQGFPHDEARDPTHALIFTLINEVVLFKQRPQLKFTSACFLDRLSEALEDGEALKWPEFIYQKLCSKLRYVKEMDAERQVGNFPGSPWIAEILKLSEGKKQVGNPQDLGLTASRGEELDRCIGALTQELEEAEWIAEANSVELDRSKEKIRVLEESEEMSRVLEWRSEANRLELEILRKRNRVLEEYKEKIQVMLEGRGEADRLDLEDCKARNQALEKKCSSLQVELDSIVELARSSAGHFHKLTARLERARERSF